VKTLDHSSDSLVPKFRLEIPALRYMEAITANGSDIAMTRQSGAAPETATLKKEDVMVADAGLAQLLATRLDELGRGETLKFRIVVASRLAAYKFRARRVGETTYENRPATQVQVDMDSFLKLFAGPLTFTYDTASHRLLEFRGVTSVLNPATGKAFTVRIVYPTVRPKDAPALPP
jgi:hypothetical protein